MNRRTWLTSLLALLFVPWMFRAAKRVPPKNKTIGYIQTTNSNPTIQIGEDCPNGWIELRGGEGGIEYVLHSQKPKRKRLAMEAKKT